MCAQIATSYLLHYLQQKLHHHNNNCNILLHYNCNILLHYNCNILLHYNKPIQIPFPPLNIPIDFPGSLN